MWMFGPRLLPTKKEKNFAAAGDRSQGKLGGEGPMVRTVKLNRYGMERAVIETFVAGHTTTILDRLHQNLASSREQTPHDVLHRFAPLHGKGDDGAAGRSVCRAVARDAFRSSQVRGLFERCGPWFVAQARANPVGESNA
jgi:hypothetical protein